MTIKINLKNIDELTAMYWFVVKFRIRLPQTDSENLNELLQSILDDVQIKIEKKQYTESKSFTLGLKRHEAIALFSTWMDSNTQRPENSHYYYSIITQKMNEIHRKIVSLQTYKRFRNVPTAIQ